MLRELYVAALGMLPQQTRLELAAHNLANLSTAGYKRELLFQSALISVEQNLRNVPGDAESADPPVRSYTDFSPGPLQQTGNPLDLALEGPGFFVVQDALGQRFLTRRGSFQLTADGALQTPDGKELVGTSGVLRIPLQLLQAQPLPGEARQGTLPPLEVTPEGELRIQGVVVGQLLIVGVQLSQLRRIDGVQFAPLPGAVLTPLSAEEYRVRQGFLEGSNVNPVEELVQLIELQRRFELGHRVIRSNDVTLERSIELSRFV